MIRKCAMTACRQTVIFGMIKDTPRNYGRNLKGQVAERVF
jgi:hypothetical protein